MVTKNDEIVDTSCDSISIQTDDMEKTKSSKQIIYAEKQREKMAALGQLAGGIAHDFNNQLMSIIGNATMIQKTDDINKMKEYAERIIHISQSTANLTKKILLFSRKESSTNEPINLKNVMDNTYAMVDAILDKKITVKYNYNASEKVAMGNETQIENLIFNLIINSRDAISSNGTIKFESEDSVIFIETLLSHGEVIKPGEYIKIIVQDDGMGMSEDTLNKIFEPYFSTKTKTKGTGLGLSVVFGTIKSHSGFVNVNSIVNKGTTVEVYLPIIHINQNLYEMNSNQNDLNNNFIMLVDDDINVLDIEAEMFEDLGYEVKKFFNPIEALEYYREEYKNINFVVLDMMMPYMNGKELYKELQKINKDVTSIFISGYSGQTEYEELIKKGSIFIEKPFTFDELSTQIAKIYS